MTNHRDGRGRAFFGWAGLVGALLAALLVIVHAAEGMGEGARAVVVPGRLGGVSRPLAFLATDKPIYKPGELVYLRASALWADTFFPVRETLPAKLVVKGPRGDIVSEQSAALADSVAGFGWRIPPGAAGGRYTATVAVNGSAPAERQFEIRVYAPPRLKSQIQFVREGYGPGDTVNAAVHVTRAEGGVPAGAKVAAVARVDGAEVARIENLALDAGGDCSVAFPLPRQLAVGDGTLAFLIADGGVVETATKTIPILLQTLDLAFHPEGGDLVRGLRSRVYVQARRPDGKPADIEGVLVPIDGDDREMPLAAGIDVDRVVTVHEGRGSFLFMPKSGERRALRVVKPAGIDRLFPLPEVKASGATLIASRPAYPFDAPVKIMAQATPELLPVRLTLHQRERLLSEAVLARDAKEANALLEAAVVELDPKDAEGVLIVTAWDAGGKPLAERLLFRQPKFAVTVKLVPETAGGGAGAFSPGGRVRLNVETTDENGRPVEAVVGLSVTNDAVLEMVETRDQAPGLPVMAYLENEVKDLADAHVYFDPANPNAARDIDLLLGTQGWRRFILVKLDELLKTHPEAARRALAMMEPPPPPPPAMPVAFFAGAARVDFDEAELFNAAPLPMAAAMPGNAAVAERAEEPAPPPAQPAEAEEAPAVRRDQREAVAMDMIRAEGERKLRPAAEALALVAIREYAHAVRPNRKPNDRSDFTETLYWNAGVRTNPRDGKATVEFGLSDSVTAFRVRADAFGTNGALGAATAAIESVEPFYVEPKLPAAVVAGDAIDLPVVLANATGQALEKPNLVVRAEGLSTTPPTPPAALPAGARVRSVVPVKTDKAGEYALVLSAAADGYADTATRTLTVLPRGFPVQQTASGILGPDKPFARTFAIAADATPGSMKASAKIHPTPLANMEEALNALLRQPYGCFEQASSTNYPVVMAQQYFTSHQGVSPEKIRRGAELLDEGYRKLVGFECKEKGYEWFGGDPGHEALTAYGLMQFTEMKAVAAVDEAMLLRTRAWLLSRRDGQGGFKRNERALDSFGAAPAPLTNLYILWTLLESGEDRSKLAAEIAAAKKLVADTKDPYLLALGANVLFLAKDLPAARAAADKARGRVGDDGGIDGAETSITRSGGESLKIETTALAVLAWLRLGDDYAGTVETGMKWLFEACKAGRFGTTQSTILALKAINAYDKARARPKQPGTAQLRIDGKPFGNPVAFDDKTQGAVELPDFVAALTPGEHKIELAMTGGGDMPFTLAIAYNTPQPANAPECLLRLATRLSAKEIAEGEPLDLHVELSVRDGNAPMPLAIIGLPAGVEPRHERLKELVAAGRIASYEVLGRELALYWRALKAGETVALDIPCVADIPGAFTAPASRAYLYYTDEHKFWIPGETVTIRAKP